MESAVDAGAGASEVEDSVTSAPTMGMETSPANALALEYLSEPSSSSIAMMRNAFKGLLDESDESLSVTSMEQQGL